MSLVAVVGRPNVGKSTLVNRIAGCREAIVEASAGVTRDRKYVPAEWQGKHFTLIDTGGLDFREGENLVRDIRAQALFAVREADAVIFVVDSKAGLTGADEEAADVLRRAKKPVILAANKWDDPGRPAFDEVFYKLGLGNPIAISAAHGVGIGDLLDAAVEDLPVLEREESVTAAKIAIVGRPNVGKSSILNRVLGQERAIVSELAGTTRDTIDSRLVTGEKTYVFMDTAGLRRRSKVSGQIEYYSSLRVLTALDRSEIALLIIDADEGVTDQDQRIAAAVADKGRALVVLLNKWDMVPGEEAPERLNQAKEALRFIGYAPLLTVSAITGRGLDKLLSSVDKVMMAYRDRIPTADLNKFIEDNAGALEGASAAKRFRVMYGAQVATAPPVIVFFTTLTAPHRVATTYRRGVENLLRRDFDFTGSPIRLRFRGKEQRAQGKGHRAVVSS